MTNVRWCYYPERAVFVPLAQGQVLCRRSPRPDDDSIWAVPPQFEDMLGRPEWTVGAYDRLVSELEMDQARASNGLRVHGRGVV